MGFVSVTVYILYTYHNSNLVSLFIVTHQTIYSVINTELHAHQDYNLQPYYSFSTQRYNKSSVLF